MNDRELLELAAKSIGIGFYVFCETHGGMIPEREDDYVFPFNVWNPLTDDGDALRLAVTLWMNLEIGDDYVYACCRGNYREPAKPDICAALRRAIVRAAAEIGRAMP